MSARSSRRLVVVDDDLGDQNLIRRALKSLGKKVELLTANDAEAAVRLIDDGSAISTPTVVLLDLNLVSEDGRDVLRVLEQRGRLAEIAVVVFTNSRRPEDVRDCYRLGAKSFLRKPRSFRELEEVLERLLDYWFEVVELPRSA